MYFENNRVVNFENLEQLIDEDGNRVYSERLLQGIQGGNFNVLYEIDIADRNNRYFMEPLLFAVKNSEFSTYEVFKYYGEELQKNDMTIATEIVLNEPDVIEDTAISDNETAILYLAKINPEVILYMSDDLKNDGEFIEELCKTGDREIINYAVNECNISEVIADNPSLATNALFMSEAIKEDANALQYADESLRNDYKFIRKVSKDNKEVIDYVAEHTESFGKEALNGAKDSLEEKLLTETKKEVEAGRAKLEEEKDALTPEQARRKERDLNGIDKMLKKFEEAETPEKKGRIAHFLLVTAGMERYKNMDEYPNGVAHEKMDPEFRKELEKYEKLYLAAKEKEKSNPEVTHEQTETKDETKVATEQEVKEKVTITPEQIEGRTTDARISEINGETQAIREEYIRETKEVERDDNDRGTIEE